MISRSKDSRCIVWYNNNEIGVLPPILSLLPVLERSAVTAVAAVDSRKDLHMGQNKLHGRATRYFARGARSEQFHDAGICEHAEEGQAVVELASYGHVEATKFDPWSIKLEVDPV